MKFFIGIVPPTEIFNEIQKIKHESHSEPHITVKAQAGLDEDLLWLDKIKQVCENFQAFDVKLTEPRYFGEDVLFLGVESEQISTLHKELVKAVSPDPELSKQYFEWDAYVPHLTIAQRSYGMTYEQLEEVKAEVRNTLYPFPTFNVNFIRVYCKEHRGEAYKKYVDIPLNG